MLNCWDASDTHHRVSAGWSYCKKVWGCRCNCSSTPTAESLFRWEQHNVTNWRPLSRHWGEVLAVEGETQSRWGISLSLSDMLVCQNSCPESPLGLPLSDSVSTGRRTSLVVQDWNAVNTSDKRSEPRFFCLVTSRRQRSGRRHTWFKVIRKKKKEKNGRPINQTGNRG